MNEENVSINNDSNNATVLLNQLTDSQKLSMAATVLGFSQMPVDIDTFLDDDYFMGSFYNGHIYPYWRDQLHDIFKNPIFTDYKIIVPKGAIGTGKSTFSIAMALYDLYKLSCLESLDHSFKLMKNTPISIRCFNMTKGKANEVLVGPMMTQIYDCPYFQDYIKRVGTLPFNCIIGGAKQATDIISECLIFSLVSEANFMKPWVAEDIITTSLSRMGSRLQMVEGIFGHILLDSSSTLKDSVVEQFLLHNAYEDKTKVIQTTIWDAKAHQGFYFVHGSFNVYAGDSNVKPHIIEKGEDTTDYDKDRIIKVPEECRPLFENDIIKALNDQAGISLDNNEEFIQDKEAIDRAMTIHQDFDDELIVDFFDEEQIYNVIGDDVLSLLPEDRMIYGRLDLGLVQDRAGVSLGYLEKAEYKEVNERKIFVPHICIPVNFTLSRKPGQETSIDKIIDFFIWVATQRHIAKITTDQFQSSAIRQKLNYNNIKAELMSVDRTDEAYVLMKSLLLQGRLTLCDCPLLKYELKNVIRAGNKVDHKPTTSKDCADAMVGVCKMISDDGEDAAIVPDNIQSKRYVKMLKDLNKKRSMTNFGW